MRGLVGLLGVAVAGIVLFSADARCDDKAKAEKVSPDKLPKAVADAIKARFPKGEITSAEKEIEDGKTIYEVAIKYKGAKIEASFTPEGKFVEAEKTIDVKDLPKAVTDAIETKYPKATIMHAEEVTKPDNFLGYEVVIETADKKKFEIELDAKGKILQEESKDKKPADKKQTDKKETDKK